MYKFFLIIIIGYFMAPPVLANDDARKQDQIRDITGIVNKVVALAEKGDEISEDEVKEKALTSRLVGNISDPDILYKIALICNTISLPGNASDIKYDVWFIHTYWACINRLSEIKTLNALEALKIIADYSSLDGGDKLILKEIILNHKAKLNDK